MTLLGFALLVAALAGSVVLLVALVRTDRMLGRTRAQLSAVQTEALRLQQDVDGLARYRAFPNAEEHVRVLLQTASQQARVAADEAERIVAAAKQKADEIANGARAAIQEARDLEKTVAALRNVIDGYGDQYIVPTQGLLDRLGEEVGFSEAGQRLKVAREAARKMIKSGQAATCEYAEESRRATAIAFVIDAFNGKVDSILADVKDDNFGTLEQKIKDAFALVNHNGQAFREARITPAYLAARLDELRWAVAAQELRTKEREEQRLLKERIREEEKAQREYEKAMRDAAREEELLRKAMETAKNQLAKATDEQKAKYESQLAELNEKLRAAEEKNQRALSMAQQTKAGHVYVISNVGSFGENVYKIGLTRRLEPLERVKELGDASVPFEFDVHALIRADDAPALEHELHRKFVLTQVNKVNVRKEFFRLDVASIRAEVERLGFSAAWTMTAEAREYKETRAIEQASGAQRAEQEERLRARLDEYETVPEVEAEPVG